MIGCFPQNGLGNTGEALCPEGVCLRAARPLGHAHAVLQMPQQSPGAVEGGTGSEIKDGRASILSVCAGWYLTRRTSPYLLGSVSFLFSSMSLCSFSLRSANLRAASAEAARWMRSCRSLASWGPIYASTFA